MEMAAGMADSFGMPIGVAYDGICLMLTAEKYQCAICLLVHEELTTISIYCPCVEEVEVVVLWAACPTCVNEDNFTDEHLDAMGDLAEGTLTGWVNGALEPQGAVVMLMPGEES